MRATSTQSPPLPKSASLVVAELATNAATHGAVPGRDALLRLTRADGRLRIEVSLTRGERHATAKAAAARADAETGRGLLIVEPPSRPEV
ncbi:ATP-binding protein [Streptomyces griseorubiginosus]|uniref:ATP-binding protein n=1 Tax=Streptomyces griseorubiginosus TaxID=67304 RepID=UPI0027E3625B|nr:ATP-binding protein [Streptomyces griseorubiginosus]